MRNGKRNIWGPDELRRSKPIPGGSYADQECSVSETKIKVPDGMMKAFIKAVYDHPENHRPTACVVGSQCSLYAGIIAALRWQRNNAPIPTTAQANRLWQIAIEQSPDNNETTHAAKNVALAWVRMMYEDPESEVPEEVKDLMSGYANIDKHWKQADENIIEAFRRGQKAGSKG
jgi:hypothetical protein